ncbi:hypothetical protein UA08_03899 [Talaromyces atroroseus]|uniref:SWIM-type domain-containing protein n=1 Tax=Talaromyces atroroseus TaxID=1441469 RepID=A0A225AJB2_TALAT|nr:hypothetical protein UA08_03899 [Talaromyces atroroseus]OKL61562.1 hypothetical protein UA08_03899 [Talaromyces atroroseus]
MPTTRSQAHRRHFRSPPASSESSAATERRHPSHATQKRSEDAKRGLLRGRGRRRRRSSRRGEHHHHHHQSEGENSNSDNEESSPSDAIAPVILAAKSRILYDIESLEMESRARALAGLKGQFDVVYCREISPFYEFQLSERPRIRIHDGGAECTCSEYENRPDMACRHIFWLVDQVYDSISKGTAPLSPAGLPLSRDGFSPKLPHIHTLLNDRLESLAAHLEWPFIPINESTTARLGYGEAIAGGLSRQEQVRDIMSAFNKVTLPEDFRKDLVEASTATPRTPEQCVVQGDFEATLFRLAVHDNNVYSSICKAMPTGACAAIYFDKVQQQSRNLLLHFDEYRRSGRLPSGRQSLEVYAVARELRQHVQKIRNNLALRVPYGTKGAVEALVTLLQDVSSRNIDAFENSPWGRIAPAGEDADDRNLYEQLIGQANSSRSSNRGVGGGGEEALFILDVLGEVPASVLGSYLSNLFDILAKVEINRAPSSFVLKLKTLIQDAQSGQGRAVKRPATAEAGGGPKRAR